MCDDRMFDDSTVSNDRRRLRQHTLASYLAMAAALVLVVLLGAWGAYHSGLSTDWLAANLRAGASRVALGWTVVIGGMVLVLLVVAFSLRRVGWQAADLQRRLDQADLRRATELSQLIIGLAHEIRNPLNAVRLNLYAIGKMHRREAALADDEIADVLHQSASEIERIDLLMREMLGYARAEPHDAEDVDLGAAVRDMLGLLRRALDDEQVTVETRWPDEPARVRIAPSRLRQILLNLLNNAREAMGPGGRIEVEAAAGPGCWELIVSDDGPGVPAAQRQSVFLPFYSTKALGLGLGLSLVKKYTEEGGGQIHCETRPGGGGRFRVRLPAAPAR
ncbi:MAG TPA: HAMP domain-containing sensor histidine kinase [Pirellulales bacterium]|nr:HAMP domain-containing sensor histidine kinase [Pirellulales bacterium]